MSPAGTFILIIQLNLHSKSLGLAFFQIRQVGQQIIKLVSPRSHSEASPRTSEPMAFSVVYLKLSVCSHPKDSSAALLSPASL